MKDRQQGGGCMTATEKDIKKRPSPAVQEMDVRYCGVVTVILSDHDFYLVTYPRKYESELI